ncbi:MAG: rod shape-determining protein MreD [Gemmatimonadota bacterium]|nr:MAG: rod shape-determining protein MreD [Gemmatimonadota bacterium]
MRPLSERWRLAALLLLLVVLQFAVRPLPGDSRVERVMPDFLFLALLVYAIRARPGQGAVAGFVVGLVTDALSPAAFGAGALAHTVIGYLAAWGKTVFFADNLVVNATFFFAGTWIRDLLVLLIGRHVQGAALYWQIGYFSPLKALTTAMAGMAVLLLFRRLLHIRIRE